jgi:hypothetical protein
MRHKKGGKKMKDRSINRQQMIIQIPGGNGNTKRS